MLSAFRRSNAALCNQRSIKITRRSSTIPRAKRNVELPFPEAGEEQLLGLLSCRQQGRAGKDECTRLGAGLEGKKIRNGISLLWEWGWRSGVVVPEPDTAPAVAWDPGQIPFSLVLPGTKPLLQGSWP